MPASDAPGPAFIPSLIYRDNRAALHWLETAFGFETSEVLTDGEGNIVHAQMTHAGGIIMIGNEWADWTRSPASLDGRNTQRLHVRIASDIDAHCERARRAGAVIAKEPSNEFYGDRTYMAKDPEGHSWSFFQPVQEVTRAEMEAASGFRFEPLA